MARVAGAARTRYKDMMNAVGTAPVLKPFPIWTPQQIQQQVNAIYTRADLKAKSNTRTAEIDLAGRGFASDSPIMQAIRMGNEGFGLAASTEQAAKIQIDAAQANAEMIVKSSEAAVEVFSKEAEAFTELEKNAVSLNVGMFQAAASLLAGVV